MSETDVIVSAFATPPQQSFRALAQDLTLFANPPVVIGVEPQMAEGEILASAGFNRAADTLKAQDPQGSILRPLLRRLKGYQVRSVTLIGFSAGNQFLKRVLSGPDAAWVDGVICLDGAVIQKLYSGALHQPDLDVWGKFALKAAQDQRLFVNAFTNISSHSKQVTSTAEAAVAIMDYVQDRLSGSISMPSYDLNELVAGPPPPSVTITVNRPTSKGTVPITRTWDTMPMPNIAAIGNAWNLDYGGNAEPDHVFISRYAQRAVWNTFLAPRLNKPTCLLAPVPVAGLGEDEAMVCSTNRKIIPPDVYATDSPWAGIAAATSGLIVGISAGYWFGKLV